MGIDGIEKCGHLMMWSRKRRGYRMENRYCEGLNDVQEGSKTEKKKVEHII